MITDTGSESIAALTRALCSMLYGAAFAGAPVVWDTDRSLTKPPVTGKAAGGDCLFLTGWQVTGYCFLSGSWVPSGKYMAAITRKVSSGIISSQVMPSPVTWILPAFGVFQ